MVVVNEGVELHPFVFPAEIIILLFVYTSYHYILSLTNSKHIFINMWTKVNVGHKVESFCGSHSPLIPEDLFKL